MIRVNDRQDPNQPSTVIAGAEPAGSSGSRRSFLTPANEFTARLTQAGPGKNRFNVAIGDPDATEEGTAPDVWYGVVESWQPQGSKYLVHCRPARSIEDGIHTSADSPTLAVPHFPLATARISPGP